MRFCPARSIALWEPIAIAVGFSGKFQHMPAMRQPIDEGQGHFVAAEN
jgi:hypothetical protein